MFGCSTVAGNILTYLCLRCRDMHPGLHFKHLMMIDVCGSHSLQRSACTCISELQGEKANVDKRSSEMNVCVCVFVFNENSGCRFTKQPGLPQSKSN